MTHEEFMNIVRKKNEWKKHPEKWTQAEKLRERIMSGKKTSEELLALQEELRAFIASNPPKEELELLQGCGESLAMLCSAIKEGRM